MITATHAILKFEFAVVGQLIKHAPNFTEQPGVGLLLCSDWLRRDSDWQPV